MRIGCRTRFLLCAALLALVATSQSAQADITAVETPDGTPVFADAPVNVLTATYGWLFDVTSPGILVTALGIWDQDADGLNEAHSVGIWDRNTGALLVQGTVPIGTLGTLDDGPGISDYRYSSAFNLNTILSPGNYVIGATYTDPNALAALNITLPADSFLIDATVDETGLPFVDRLPPGQNNIQTITVDGVEIRLGGGFTRPNQPGDPNGFFGPNFKYQVVPEPSPLALMGITAVVGSGFAAIRRRLRKRENAEGELS